MSRCSELSRGEDSGQRVRAKTRVVVVEETSGDVTLESGSDTELARNLILAQPAPWSSRVLRSRSMNVRDDELTHPGPSARPRKSAATGHPRHGLLAWLAVLACVAAAGSVGCRRRPSPESLVDAAASGTGGSAATLLSSGQATPSTAAPAPVASASIAPVSSSAPALDAGASPSSSGPRARRPKNETRLWRKEWTVDDRALGF